MNFKPLTLEAVDRFAAALPQTNLNRSPKKKSAGRSGEAGTPQSFAATATLTLTLLKVNFFIALSGPGKGKKPRE